MPPAKRKRLEKKAPKPEEEVKGRPVCISCGASPSRQKGYFHVSHALMYRANGYLPYCNECVEKWYQAYLTMYDGDTKRAVRRMCMKLDLYFSEEIYELATKLQDKDSLIKSYINRINIYRMLDKNFDTTLDEEAAKGGYSYSPVADALGDDGIPHASEEVKMFWGPGYTKEQYHELEERRKYWMSKYPEGTILDIGEEALLRQICSLEIDINRDRASGKSVGNNMSTLNTLIGSMNLKPAQRKESESDAEFDNIPFGVWIKRWENTRPVPEPEPEMRDVDGIVRYIDTWFRGHLAKMCGIKNGYSKLYEDEIAKMRVERPEYDEEDDETMFYDIFASPEDAE